MDIICLDLEGVLVPEIWINFAEITGIQGLRLTTRDMSDYDELMRHRLGLLNEHKLGLPDIRSVIETMQPMPGARSFLDSLRESYQVVILSDTFYEFAMPLMQKLGWPTLLCHRLEVGDSGRVINYHLRQPDPKLKSVRAFKSLNYRVFAAGDSYNDISMLGAADQGYLFRAPQRVVEEFPQYPHTREYRGLRDYFDRAAQQPASGQVMV